MSDDVFSQHRTQPYFCNKSSHMDNENLTQLIDAFRAETANAAITPESLGSILQKILNTVYESVGGGINIVCDTKDDTPSKPTISRTKRQKRDTGDRKGEDGTSSTTRSSLESTRTTRFPSAKGTTTTGSLTSTTLRRMNWSK